MSFSSLTVSSCLSLPHIQPSLGVSRPGKAMIFVIISPVGPYFSTGSFNPVSLLADPAFVRAWKGGVGAYKMGGYVFTLKCAFGVCLAVVMSRFCA